MIAVTGNTYPVKDQIRALGGKWNPDAKAWMVPDEKADAARKLVAGAPASTRRTYSSGTGSYGGYSSSRRGTCTHCGERCNPGYRTCLECSHGGQSFTTADGRFVLGSDD